MTYGDNEWARRGPWGSFFTWIRLVVMLVVAFIIGFSFVKYFPNVIMVVEIKQTDTFYNRYIEQYGYLESTVEKVLDIRDQKLDIAMLPADIFCEVFRTKEGKMALLSVDNFEEISMELKVSDDFEVLHRQSHKLSKDDFHEKLKQDLNSYMGISVLIIIFCLMIVGDFIYEVVTFFMYAIELYKE